MSVSGFNIKFSTFYDLSNSVGGAIFIVKTDSCVDLSFSSFTLCVATGERTNDMRSKTGGGACHFDIQTANISHIFSSHCRAEIAFGHSFYVSAPLQQTLNIDCFTDEFSGKLVEYSVICQFDRGTIYSNSVNCSYPKGVNCGVVQFGSFPMYTESRFYSIVYDDLESSIAFIYSLKENSYNVAEYYALINCCDKISAIIEFFCGYHILNHFNFINCRGKLESIQKEINSLIINNSYIDSRVTYTRPEIINPITYDSLNLIHTVCSNVYNLNLKTCIKKQCKDRILYINVFLIGCLYKK